MFKTAFLTVCFFMCSLWVEGQILIKDDETWLKYLDSENVLVVASPGRSGSTMLTIAAATCAREYDVKHTHRLVPQGFKGKVIFIFSNPDIAAESALHKTLHEKTWINRHFSHVFTSDKEWLEAIGGDDAIQTIDENLLSYDALGVSRHLFEWLYNSTLPASPETATILAIKYENLWDQETINAIQSFLKIPKWKMPAKTKRGYSGSDLTSEELTFRETYNLGTVETPRYKAYDSARQIWLAAPPFQYLIRKEQ